ncbi:hypothetical protein [Bacillus sp. REN3]|uniref:hypothetical protein n=1 Tax=Bacillus sp. REN3 TaxID=2802440 RepID=UPI001AEEBD60|nr:hypothetical protein [Bacillus sp. REN3]
MSCCSPNYRKTVNEKEEQVNGKGKDQLPIYAKAILVLVAAGSLLAAYFLY